jgi:hypothetical protein
MYAYANCGFFRLWNYNENESLEQRIAKQEERLNSLKAQKQAVEAREKKKIRNNKEKDDTRRKILLGSCCLKKWKMKQRKQKYSLN